MEYEIQCSQTRDTVWIHCSDGSTVARFGKMGVDLHNTITEQLAGEPQCRLCTHGEVTLSDWELFREKCLEWWNVTVPADAFDPKYLGDEKHIGELPVLFPNSIHIDNDGNWDRESFEYSFVEEYTRTSLVKDLVDAIREEGGWGEEVMRAMEGISPESFIAVQKYGDEYGT